jgi:hypothetical protein
VSLYPDSESAFFERCRSGEDTMGHTDRYVLQDGHEGGALLQTSEAVLVENTDGDRSGIVVEAVESEVTLGGVVGSAEARDAAEWAAWSVAGVAGVDHRLVVEEPSEACTSTVHQW